MHHDGPVLFGQDAATAQLAHAIRSGHMHHAWILHGPAGVGKCTAAMECARLMLDAETGAAAHMNDDHAETCRLYATKLLGAPVGDWRCPGLDPDGLDLQNGPDALWLPFPQRVTSPGELRAVLREMAEQARAR